MDKDEIFNREGLTPQQYLEFTERFIPENETNSQNETEAGVRTLMKLSFLY